ncbi:MAG: hypothetical protein IT371_13045 [Deltaproteobacteria bacterium]|nr:hypothetical protein [Deltaproteobacteria bacterium]
MATTVLCGCLLEPAPKIAALPPAGLALRVDVFGAQAEDGRGMFDSVRQTNPRLRFVKEGGDGEILMGLDRDNAACVPPTAYCEYRVALRVRDATKKVVHFELTTVGASAESCAMICERALQKAAGLAVEKAAKALKGEKLAPPAAEEASASDDARGRAARRPARAPRRETGLCGIAVGGRLPSEDAEKRIAQVDALKRQGLLEPEELTCLRKTFLSRL